MRALSCEWGAGSHLEVQAQAGVRHRLHVAARGQRRREFLRPRARAHTQAQARTRKRTRTRICTHAHKGARAHTQTDTNQPARARVCVRRGGLACVGWACAGYGPKHRPAQSKPRVSFHGPAPGTAQNTGRPNTCLTGLLRSRHLGPAYLTNSTDALDRHLRPLAIDRI